MAGNPADERFRPPDPPLEAGNPTVHSTIHEVAKDASSTSSQLREEAVQIATVDADIDASRQNIEKGHNICSNKGAIQRVEEQMEVGKIASQEAAQEEAKSIHTPGQSEGNRQETSIGELSPVRELNTQQIGVGMEVQNV
ncbi:hypothetical protein EJD97_002267 [Solanum chilense]|uniref:Uncharacterized protein n=1 Tax=Solanum chilense TaxID=4083 RepID=A0A6N2BWN2_SOLCI|nr:hypothetical protein EJD97_002267 [Solanum chilense]